ncbi:MAG: hypothetical protein ABUT20_43475 [Bacteroidota bacterium]
MNYECVSARFFFWNGQQAFTVEYTYVSSTWYVFKDEGKTDALFVKKVASTKLINRWIAEDVLMVYLNTIIT